MADTIYCILTTYNRFEYACKTIEAMKKYAHGVEVRWIIADDGSTTPPNYVDQLKRIIGRTDTLVVNGERRGVGWMMNEAQSIAFGMTDVIMMLEDDWVLQQPLNLEPYWRVLQCKEAGMIRFGYLSSGLLGRLDGFEGMLFWNFVNNGFLYRFSGQPSLRHRRFFNIYGRYAEGKAPGETEIAMCFQVNETNAPVLPGILYPAHLPAGGIFAHIGTDSLKNVQPENGA